jgi:hypothetical protein
MQIVDQFARIEASIERLTAHTCLQGTKVHFSDSDDKARLKFKVTTPNGSELLDCYQGILLCGLESWSDQSLDRRLYQSSGASVRNFLNEPEEAAPAPIEQADQFKKTDKRNSLSVLRGDPSAVCEDAALSRDKGCSVCQGIYDDINARSGRLRETAQRGKMVCRNYSAASRGEFTGLVKSHIELSSEIQRLWLMLTIHRDGH